MQDLLMLWDAIFADSIGFDLVDYIFAAMMLYIRELCEYTIKKKYQSKKNQGQNKGV